MSSKRHVLLPVLLVVVVLVYANSFANGFHFDDFHTVVDNPAVRSIGNLPRIFADPTAFSVLPTNQTYRPVVTASLALDYALGRGYVPFPFHLSTMLWFLVLVGCLFFWTELVVSRVERSEASFWVALGVAAWFGLHPAMAETVNYVIQRGDLYCTLGCVAGLLVFARWPERRHWGLYLLPFVLAILSKPPAAVFPVLLCAFVFFFEAESLPAAARWRESLLASVPAVGAAVVMLALQSAMTPKSFLPSTMSAASYRLTQPFVWMRYAGALFLPVHLNVDTDLQPFTGVDARAVVGSAFTFALLVVVGVCARRRRLYPIAFGVLWFVVTQMPTSLYRLSEVENDHRMFFSFPGLMLAVVWALRLGYGWVRERVPGRGLPYAVGSVAVLCLCGYAYGAHRRNQVWRTEETLWADDVAKSPHNGRGLMNYGLALMNRGDAKGAVELFTRALVYTPNYATLEVNLGIAYGLLAAQDHGALNVVSERHFERAVALAPGDDTVHGFYGRWLLGQQRVPEAVGQLEEAVRLNPQRMMQRDLLLGAYMRAGRVAEARALAQSTLAVAPDDAAAVAVVQGRVTPPASRAVELIEASLAAYRAGQFQRAVDLATQAVAADPQSAEAWNNVGAGYGALRRWDEAVAADQRALELNPGLQIARNNLAWALQQRSAGVKR